MPNIEFRETEMTEMIGNVMGPNRLVMVIGLHGIGKSSVANNVLHHIYERKQVTGGVLWLQLKGTKDVYAVLKEMQKYIYKSLILNKDEINELTRRTCTERDLTEYIINFFNNYHKPEIADKFKRKKQAKKSGNEFLICFDNAEEIINREQNKFQLLLKKMLEYCPQLRLIITSNKPLNEMGNMIHPINQYVSELSTLQSVALFFETLDKIGFKGTKG